jgi:putative tributyrin esterase
MALFQVSFYSHTLGLSMQMNVILPQQDPTNLTPKKIPVLYLLHGRGDDHSTWLRQTSIERYVSDMNLAVVMPSVHLGYYTDMVHGNKYWTFVSEELPKIVHLFFNNLSDKREDNFVAGLSMGGYGALKMGLAASDQFCAVASLSGALDIASRCLTKQHSRDKEYWADIFGEPQLVKGSKNDLLALATTLTQTKKPLPKVYIWCGTEDFLYDLNITMKNHLEELQFDLTYEESPGDHQWKYWDAQIQRVLDWLPIQE